MYLLKWKQKTIWSIIVITLLFPLAFVSCLSKKNGILLNQEGETEHLRTLPLEGANNFRDLGGYKTKDGNTVKWGQVYRSGQLSNLTLSDYTYLEKLQPKLLIDLRAKEERKRNPTRWQTDTSPELLELPIGGEVQGWSDTLAQQIRAGNFTADDIRTILMTAYRTIPVKATAVYKTVFQRIVNPADRPVIIHCTAGKDRAGIGAALILSALGVPRETIMEDFMLTNQVSEIDKMLPSVTARFSKRAGGKTIDPEDVRPLLEVEPEYLEAMFSVIEQNYGSVDDYLSDALGIDEKMRDLIRRELLD
jgi:protein-tyrosine phosphatase